MTTLSPASGRPTARVWSVLLSALLLAMTVAACTAPSNSSGERDDRDVLTREEITESGVSTNAFDLIRRENPQWLTLRGGRSAVGDVVLYVDGIRRTPIDRGGRGDRAGDRRPIFDELRTISVSNIQRIRHLDARAAIARFGTGHQHGAIIIETRML